MGRLHTKIADNLVGFGGHLECMECGHIQGLGAVAGHLAYGWPKHCGYTMRWITKKQLSQPSATNDPSQEAGTQEGSKL